MPGGGALTTDDQEQIVPTLAQTCGGSTLSVPRRADAATKAGLLDLVDDAVDAGLETASGRAVILGTARGARRPTGPLPAAGGGEGMAHWAEV